MLNETKIEQMRYPQWLRDMITDHYDRIAEGIENKPERGIAEMIIDGYTRGYEDGLIDGMGGTSDE